MSPTSPKAKQIRFFNPDGSEVNLQDKVAGLTINGGAVTSVAGKTGDVVLDTLTRGNGLSGSDYNGSTATTWAVAYGSTANTAVQGNDTRVTADQAAATASIRTLGTGASQAAAGNHTHLYAGSASAGGAATSVANSQVIKFDSGTTEGTDLYTYNGSAAKTLDIKAGTNVSLTKAAGSITISANDPSVAWTELTSKPTTVSGYGITDAYTKTEVDGLVTGLDFKASVRAIATSNITLSGTQTVDGVALVATDRVLVAGQTTGSQNGIYVVAAGAWTRSTDADTSAKVTTGMYTFVAEGTTYADSGWVLTTNDTITLGTTSLVFTQFNGLGQVTAGAGLTKTGSKIDVVGSEGRIVANTDSIDLATVADSGSGTFKKITVDSYGRVTGTAAVTSDDITGAITAGTTSQVYRGDKTWVTLDLTYLPDASIKKSVKAATTAALTASFVSGVLTNTGTLAALTLDGITLAVNDRVLVKNQATTAQNGIYSVTTVGSASVAWVLTRADDADTSSKINSAIVAVDQGTTNGGFRFSTNFKISDTINTTAMVWYRVVDTGLASATTPAAAADTAVIGTSDSYARADHVHPAQTSISGNAGTATKLQNARTINGVSFDGSANVTVTTAGTGINVSGATVSVTAASAASLGGVKVGSGLAVDGSGTLSIVSAPTFNELTIVPTAGQTVFTISGGYTVGAIELYLNGVMMYNGSAYTATNGTTITFSEALSVDDTVLVRRWTSAGGLGTTYPVVNSNQTWDAASIANGAQVLQTFNVTGATLGDFVLASYQGDLQGLDVQAFVSAANTVKLKVRNDTGAAIDLVSGTWGFRLLKRDY